MLELIPLILVIIAPALGYLMARAWLKAYILSGACRRSRLWLLFFIVVLIFYLPHTLTLFKP